MRSRKTKEPQTVGIQRSITLKKGKTTNPSEPNNSSSTLKQSIVRMNTKAYNQEQT